jgi:DNA-directed RNA polymerase subunit omega
MTIETSFDSNYRKVLVAARRARQLQSGSHALVPTQSTKACRIYVKTQAPVVKPLIEGPTMTILLS